MLRALVYTGGITIRGAKLHALLRFRDSRRLHDAAEDEAVRHEARVDWLAYEASVVSASGARVIVAALSTGRAPRSPTAIARSSRDGRWLYTTDAVISAIGRSLVLDATDLCSSIENIVAATRPLVAPVSYGGELARLEAARDALAAICAPCVALEVGVVPMREIHRAIWNATPRAEYATSDLTDPIMALEIACGAQRAMGLARFFADAACILHAAGLTDQIGTVLNRIGPLEFDTYAAALASSQK